MEIFVWVWFRIRLLDIVKTFGIGRYKKKYLPVFLTTFKSKHPFYLSVTANTAPLGPVLGTHFFDLGPSKPRV